MDTSPAAQSVDRDAAVHNHAGRPLTSDADRRLREGLRNVYRAGLNAASRRFAPEKGRPPPGGEEAEVVVLQPRGVGLMHPRLRAE